MDEVKNVDNAGELVDHKVELIASALITKSSVSKRLNDIFYYALFIVTGITKRAPLSFPITVKVA